MLPLKYRFILTNKMFQKFVEYVYLYSLFICIIFIPCYFLIHYLNPQVCPLYENEQMAFPIKDLKIY